MRFLRRVCVCTIMLALPVCAQWTADVTASNPTAAPSNLVVWSAPGSVKLPVDPDWKFLGLTAHNNANRIIALYKNERLQVNASFIIFPNLSGKPTSAGCLADVVPLLLKDFRASISQQKDGQAIGANGQNYPSTSYLLAYPDHGGAAFNTFAFAGDAKTCMEIHVSTGLKDTTAHAALETALTLFAPTLGYKPSAIDLFVIGQGIFPSDPDSSSPFFGESLKLIPVTPETLSIRRLDTDQLVTSLRLSGHTDSARHYATEAIKLDPDYPMNYLNLARTDGKDAKAATAHLKLAFERKANTLPGQHLPDPVTDPAFASLQKDETFRAVVQSLPRNAPAPALKARNTAASSEFAFALPNHPGRLTFEAPSFKITEASAKPSGSEFGLRGDDHASGTEVLAFLFLYRDVAPKADQTASERCRDSLLQPEKLSLPRFSMASGSAAGVPIALAQYTQGKFSYVRAFAAVADLCADISMYNQLPITLETPEIHQILSTLVLDPAAQATFHDLNYYATALFEHKNAKAAATVYTKALALLPADDPGHKWLRYTTDQAVMSYGMSGDLKQSRALAQHAIELDPDYPLYYYNLACADAEEGNAAAARVHLEQAFARKANTLPGEHLPDPTQDDSILKLQSDKAFWTFVQSLPKG